MSHALEELIIKHWPFQADDLTRFNLSIIIQRQVNLLERLIEAKLKNESQQLEAFISGVQNLLYVIKSRKNYVPRLVTITNRQGDKDGILSDIPSSSEQRGKALGDVDCELVDSILLVLDGVNLVSKWILGLKKTSPVPQLVQLTRGNDVEDTYERTKKAQMPIVIETVYHLRARKASRMRRSGKHFQLHVYHNHILLYLLPRKKTSPLGSCFPFLAVEERKPLLLEWSANDNYDLFPYPTSETALEIRFLSKQCVMLVECKNRDIRDFLCKFKGAKNLPSIPSLQALIGSPVADIKTTKWMKIISEIPCIAYRFSQGIHSSGINCVLNIKLIGDNQLKAKNCKSGHFHLVANREETGVLMIQMNMSSLIDFNLVTSSNSQKQTYKLVLGGINDVKGEPEMWTFKLSCNSDLELIEHFYKRWINRLSKSLELEGDRIYLDTLLSVGGKKYPGALVLSNRNGSCCMECFTEESRIKFVVIGISQTTKLDLYMRGEVKVEKGVVEFSNQEAHNDFVVFMKRFMLQNDPELVSLMAMNWLNR